MKVSVNGLSIYYEVQGKGSPLLLLHGWGADSSSLRQVATGVKNQAGFKVYSLDLPGFGYSDPPPADWGVSDYVTFLEAFLGCLELDRVCLLGHSFGGRVAIKYAARHPQGVERLVLVDSAGILPKRKADYYLKVGLAKTLKFLRRAFPGLQKAGLLPKLGSSDYQKAGALRGTFVKVVNEDLQPCLPLIQSPTLLIWGASDPETPAADGMRMQQLIAGARLEIIANAGHFCFQDNFEAFQAILLKFLGENAA
jgi:pimeloyl-ACP methyl ester carboxylesterase